MSETAAITPSAYARRSPIWRLHAARDARFEEINGAAIAASYGGNGEDQTAVRLGLCDLSVLPRTGVKGPGALDWLRAQGVVIGDENNRATVQEGGALVARLAPGEALVLDDIEARTGLSARLEARPPDAASRAHPVLRSSANFWFLVSGAEAPAMFAKICAIDLRVSKFSNLAVAQTSVARSNAILVRDDRGKAPAFHLLGDCASAEYMWGCLLDAMEEFDGAPVGTRAVLGLEAGDD